MLTAFTRHPHDQGMTYAGHWKFAMGIAWRLLTSVLAFAVHAMMPFIPIKRHLDLEATAAFLYERNRFVEAAAADRTGRLRALTWSAAPETEAPVAHTVKRAAAMWVTDHLLIGTPEWLVLYPIWQAAREWLGRRRHLAGPT